MIIDQSIIIQDTNSKGTKIVDQLMMDTRRKNALHFIMKTFFRAGVPLIVLVLVRGLKKSLGLKIKFQ